MRRLTSMVAVCFFFVLLNLAIAETPAKASGSVSKEETMVSDAFQWKGEIIFDVITVADVKCFMPISFSNLVTSLDDQYTITSIQAAVNYGGNTVNSNGLYEGISSQVYEQNIENPDSGEIYEQLTPSSSFWIDAASAINMDVFFMYRQKDSSVELVSPTVSVVLSDSWKNPNTEIYE